MAGFNVMPEQITPYIPGIQWGQGANPSQFATNGISGLGGQGGGFGGGFNWGGMSGLEMGQLGLGVANTGMNIWQGLQANKLAREQFGLTKSVTNTNLNNAIKTYNTQLAGKARARGAMEGQSAADTQAYVDENKLTRS